MSPSERAIKLVRGAYDLHVRIEPDVIPRRTHDLELAQRFREQGLAGLVLKSQYATAERALLARRVVPEVEVPLPGWGLNPVAVEIAAREEARIVWLPTVDAANEALEADALAPDKNPIRAKLRAEFRFREAGLPLEPIEVRVGTGRVVPLKQWALCEHFRKAIQGMFCALYAQRSQSEHLCYNPLHHEPFGLAGVRGRVLR